MLVTALNPHIGYEKAAEIAKHAHREGDAARGGEKLGLVELQTFDGVVDPKSTT